LSNAGWWERMQRAHQSLAHFSAASTVSPRCNRPSMATVACSASWAPTTVLADTSVTALGPAGVSAASSVGTPVSA
jgi:hypothetical protein